ncbi:TraB/GumN family protein [Desulfobacter vibrioformis]|uniref:TraB/GumN family protein n=1 Tax=Desulfobacter vibrioformis TaxID=34031 RepID=UPI00054DCDD2|nr:TraB/GumN family protein [Desulfobacter vibrioformis]
MNENPMDDNDIHMLDRDGKQIILIGTAHVSRHSAQLVSDTIASQQPDSVCVELCNNRLAALQDKDRWQNMDIVKIIKEKKALMLFMNLLLASFQKKIADKFGIKPGQEMINAIEAAEKTGAAIIPADREIQTTLSRIWRGMGVWEKIKLIFSMVLSFGQSDDIEEADIEKMKHQDILQSLLSEIKEDHPIIGEILINERDQFLAQSIRSAPGNKILAVVGAAHVPGILKYIEQDTPIDLAALKTLPPPGKAGKILKWLIPGLIVMLFIAGFLMGGKGAGTDMIWIWVLANGIFAGIGALIARAHPYTIFSSVVAAPLTSLNPMIAAGWVAGLVEAFARKPKVRDLEAIPGDITSVKGFWKNNVTRILLVVVFTNLGSSIGTMTALPLMIKLLS